MKVRTLLPSDRAGLLRLLDQSYDEVKRNPGLGESLRLERPKMSGQVKWFDEIRKLVRSGDAVFYVAEEKGDVIGFCSVVKKDIPESEMSHIGVLGVRVAEGWRGRGIGSKLMKQVLDKCKGKFEIVELFVFKPNEDAQRLYERFGFKAWGVAPRYIKRGKKYLDTVYMYLNL